MLMHKLTRNYAHISEHAHTHTQLHTHIYTHTQHTTHTHTQHTTQDTHTHTHTHTHALTHSLTYSPTYFYRQWCGQGKRTSAGNQGVVCSDSKRGVTLIRYLAFSKCLSSAMWHRLICVLRACCAQAPPQEVREAAQRAMRTGTAVFTQTEGGMLPLHAASEVHQTH